MIVVVEHLLEWAAIYHGLVAFETFALFPLKRFDRYGTKFNSLNCAPWIGVALENLDSIEASLFKRGEETVFGERTGNAAAPKLRIALHLLRHLFIAHNVRNHCVPAFFENAKNLIEEFPFRLRLNQIKHAIRNDHVDGFARNQGIL